MDQGQLEGHTTRTLERLTRMETVQEYQHDTLIRIHLEMDELRREMKLRGFGEPLGASGWLKLGAALLLPFLVLMSTGSPKEAIQAAMGH